MPIKWCLLLIMAQRGIWSGADLQRLLFEKTGLQISSPGIMRLMAEDQVEIKLRVLDALCIALDCRPGDLLFRQNLSKIDQTSSRKVERHG